MRIIISIVICTYNRCASLKETLGSLCDQALPEDIEYEIIVVDNKSGDRTKEIVKDCNQKLNRMIKYCFESDQGLSYARNRGIREAKGEVVIFTDDDCIADKEWVRNIISCFDKYKCESVGGRTLPLYPPGTPLWIKVNKELLNGPIPLHDYGEDTKLYIKESMNPFIGANMAFKIEIFNKYGLFRTDLGAGKGTMGEDTDLFYKMVKNNNIYYCGKALVWHKADKKRMSLKYIAKWNIAYGRYLVIEDKNKDKKVYNSGYIFPKIINETVTLVKNILKARTFLKEWTMIFIYVGMILEYRRKCKVK